MSTRSQVTSLYRRALKLSLDWTIHRNLWRGQAMYLRDLFEANKHVTDPRQQRIIIKQTEDLLEKWKHPDPYRPPTAPGGSKYERNLPAHVIEPPPEAEFAHLYEAKAPAETPEVAKAWAKTKSPEEIKALFESGSIKMPAETKEVFASKSAKELKLMFEDGTIIMSEKAAAH